MLRLCKICIALTLVLLVGTEVAYAQCSLQYVKSNIQGVWKVNNAAGATALGFGNAFGTPQVNIAFVGQASITINGKGPFPLGNFFAPEPNPQGGMWCSFVIKGVTARMYYRSSDRWWIFTIGELGDRNKQIELIRR